MREVKKLATRDSYGMALCELAKKHTDFVVLDADLAAATKTGMFKKEYPDRFFDCGISEANMVGVAAGLATTGIIPFATSFAMFSTGRAYEQIRNMVGYPHLVTVLFPCPNHAPFAIYFAVSYNIRGNASLVCKLNVINNPPNL